ncbi:MAG TPA: MliC family protein [Microvirga sp.]|nr:MliC family protein [Microvirga sp.]
MIRGGLACVLCLLPGLGQAADIVLRLPQGPSVTRTVVTYACEGRAPMRVEYINAGPNALAVVPLTDGTLVFVNVLSGSGARYASGPYIWWTKGAKADLYDQRQGESAKPISCEVKGG